MPLGKKPLELNGDFKHALDVLEKTDKSLFITGRAGTGKSTLLQLFRQTTRKKMVVCAPTGIAALNVKGQTIHSLFGFPPRFITAGDIKKSSKLKWLQKVDVLVVDEISMVRADLLDAMDRSLRINRENPAPFGGLQVVLIGDLFQLPPIVASEEERRVFEMAYESPYFFSANAMRGVEMEMVELAKVYRQENRHFLRLLDAVRVNQADWEDLEDLNVRHLPDHTPTGNYITLSPRNATVDRINQSELANLFSMEFTFRATITGEFDPRLYPTDQVLRLKQGAQVMFLKNDPDGRFVNGTIGKITEIDPDNIKVETDEGGTLKLIEVPKMDWDIIRYKPGQSSDEIESEVVGTFNQYPLRLAWAVTIHKSQGKTFDKVVIDMGKGAFETGQTYVALSRCRTLEGIVLKQPLTPRDILIDDRVVAFYEQHF